MTIASVWSRIRYLLSTPREIWTILLIGSAIFSAMEIVYYAHYLATLQGITDKDGEPFGRDFISYWTAILLLKGGDISGIYSPSVFAARMYSLLNKSEGMFWGYPPHYLFLLWPFTYISWYKTAYAAWSALNLAAFMFAVFWRTRLSASWRWLVLSAPIVFAELFIGQNGLLSSALLIGGFRLLAPMPWAAGVLFGLLTFKPQLGILIPFILLALKQHKAFAGAALTCVLLVLASGLAFGWQSWEGFFYDMQHFPQGAFNKMISVSAAVRSLGGSVSAGLLVQTCVTLILIPAIIYRFSRIRQAHWTEWLQLAVPAIYLVTPYAFPYDLCALSATWIFWLQRQGEKKISFATTLVWLSLWYMPLFSESLHENRLPLTPLLLMLAFATAWKETRNC